MGKGVTSSISTRSKVALVTLISVSVLGSVYYSRYKHNKNSKKKSIELADKKLAATIDDNSLYNDFVACLPSSLSLIDDSADNFLSSIFNSSYSPSDYIPGFIPTSIEELKEQMASLYPNFQNQFETIRDMYNSFWDFLSLEEFRNIVRESIEEDDDPEMHPEIEQDAYVRTGQALSDEEIQFTEARKRKMRAAFAFFIGVDEHEVEIEDIPNIGIASSGGGYRAMVACSGYLHALNETGILDCVMYMAGVSGSTWAMSQFYSPLTDASVDTLKDHLSSRIHTHIANLSNFLTVLNASRHNAKILLHGIVQRYYQQNGSISLVDIFGMLLGGTLLARKVTVAPADKEKSERLMENDAHSYTESIEDPSDLGLKNKEDHTQPGTVHEDDGAEVKPRLLKKNEIKLSMQKDYFQDGSLPMPIYCAVRHEVELASVTKAATVSSKQGVEPCQKVDDEEEDETFEHVQAEDAKSEAEEEEEEESKEDNDNKTEENEDEDEKEDQQKEEAVEEEMNDLYQWFEFTPYDMGSEEINAWIPIWAFGRKFENGKNTERLPEQSLGILMGMFGSAFVASLAHFYQEIRLLLPSSAIEKADEMINSYQASVSTIHPISPASFPNPFYKMSTTVQSKDASQDKEEVLRSESLVESELIGLMDAGMDNNLPFYPLLRQGRDVDIILAIDLSAEIQEAPYFDRAEGYVKRRGIKGWPVGAGWPRKEAEEAHESEKLEADPVKVEHQKKPSTATDSSKQQQQESQKSKYALDTCTVFASSSSETIPSNSDDDDASATTTSYPENVNPITLVYFPLIVNENYDPEFDPQTAEFCSTWNFVYSSEQVNKLHGLGEANVKDNLEKVRKVIKETWKRKRDERLKREDLSRI
ncbi:hypothetical protein MBANPS3_003755 [Mucor bainieri]